MILANQFYLRYKRILKGIKNPFQILLLLSGLKRCIILKYYSGKSVSLNNRKEFYDWWLSTDAFIELCKRNYINIPKNKNYVEINGLKFYYADKQGLSNILGSIREHFEEKSYAWLNVISKDVLDIGANIGSTTVYFLHNGAKHVYAYEPFGKFITNLKKTIELNGFQDKVTIVQGAVTGTDGKTKINSDNERIIEVLDAGSGNQEIPSVSLNTIVKKYHLNDAVMKIDTEGAEYEIIGKADSDTLQSFNQIQIEYHYGHKELVSKLRKNGFKVKYTWPEKIKLSDQKLMYVGFIYAQRT